MTKEYQRPKEYWASVYTKGKCAKRKVKCLISFSKNPSLYPRIAIILKNNSTFQEIASSFNIDVKAKRYDMSGKLISEVKTEYGHYVNPDERFYDNLHDKYILEIGYSRVIYKTYLSTPIDNLDESIIIFHLVNINFSFTFGGVFHDENGIHHDLKSYFGDFNIIDDATISFSSERRYGEIDEDTLKRYSNEVLKIKYDKNKSNLNRLESFVKSFLPYLTFLSRSIVWYNHFTEIKEGSNVISEQFFVLLSEHSKNRKYSFERDYAIDRSHHKQFINDAISKLVSGDKIDIRSIHQYNYAISQPVSQSSYVMLFMSLEALITNYITCNKRNFTNYLVRTFPKKKGGSKKDYFKKVIRPKNKFWYKYNFIMSESKINNSDLWPLYDDKVSYLNLSRIRNKIVHEGKIRDLENLWCAFHHLEWIYLRLFLYIVGWNGPNNLNPKALTTYIPYRDWQNMLIYK
jgi:hypothetical protein